ncbi:MAG: aminotransferase class V-fold PLP-dependent enzyme [Firmicutes bacterium]|nr:aminotransferase class V-fold PLP-dependent enzyme [Bacillota bacterium]
MTIYLDNSATSFPKAPGVAAAMTDYLENVGCNINRGGYAKAYGAAYTVLETRERIAGLFHFAKPQNVIFTANVTASLNYLIKGLLAEGGRLLVSQMEHNAVMRPLRQMVRERGAAYTQIPCDRQGLIDLAAIPRLITGDVKGILVTHASNVSGSIVPIGEVGEICRRHGLPFIVDTAQTAGALDIDMEAMHIDALAFTGHKGLLGPQGIGGFVISDDLAQRLPPLLSGGTGSFSDSEDYPQILPDKFEPGTMNLPGIYGLNAALKYIEQEGTAHIRQQEMALWQRFYDGCRRLPQTRIIGTGQAERSTAVLSLDFLNHDNAEISFLLDQEHQIMTRCGIHCAPSAHKCFDTFPQGTVRFSFNHFNTAEEIDAALAALRDILSR